MVSERAHRYLQYTATLHSWLPNEVANGHAAGRDRYRALLSYFEPDSTGASRIRKIVLEVMRMDAVACRSLFNDVDTVAAMESESIDTQRWRVICLRLAALLPENLLAPEVQLTQMEMLPDKEDLLGFCKRYRQTAESFVAERRGSRDRAVLILYNKLPVSMKRDIMVVMSFAEASLMRIEEAVRRKIEWLAVMTPGTFPMAEMVQYLPSMHTQHLQALASNPSVSMSVDGMDFDDHLGSHVIPGLINSDGSVDYTKIRTADHVMIAWKKLMANPRYHRGACQHLQLYL